jgi:hypothetical protein
MWLLWLLIGVVIASIGWFFVWRNNKKKFELADVEAQQYIDAIESKLNSSDLTTSVKVELANLLSKIKK